MTYYNAVVLINKKKNQKSLGIDFKIEKEHRKYSSKFKKDFMISINIKIFDTPRGSKPSLC